MKVLLLTRLTFLTSSQVHQPVYPDENQKVTAADGSSFGEIDWEETYDDIPDFQFDHASAGVQIQFDGEPEPLEIFKSLCQLTWYETGDFT